MAWCGTLKEAELIPDSAVPYTLLESRWNSSNRQTRQKRRGKGREKGISHTSGHVWALKKCLKKSGRVRERANRSWLVRERSWQLQYLCGYWSVFGCVWGQWRRFWLQRRKGGEREGVAVSAVSAAGRSAAEQWQNNPAGWQTRVWGHTQTQAWHAVRKQSVAHCACLCLCWSVYSNVCIHLR